MWRVALKIAINIVSIVLRLVFYSFLCVLIYSCGQRCYFAVRSAHFASSSRFSHQAQPTPVINDGQSYTGTVLLFRFLPIQSFSLTGITF